MVSTSGGVASAEAVYSPSFRSLVNPSTESDRVLYLDWLRTIAVYLVAIVHTAVSLARVSSYSSNALQQQYAAIRGLIQFGMPFFFYLSGSAAYLSHEHSFMTFMRKKLLRLAIPCFIGLIFIVLPTAYIGRHYRPCAAKDIHNFFDFAYDFFANQFACGGFEWLWFLPVSFFLSIANFPLFAVLRSTYKDENVILLSLPSLLFDGLWLLFIMLAAFCATLYFHISLLQACLVLTPYLVSVPIYRSLSFFRRCRVVFLVMLACNVAPSLALAYGRRNFNLPDIAIGIIFYNMFYIEGFVSQLLSIEYGLHRKSLLFRLSMPGQMLIMILLISLCFPSELKGVGYLFSYPLYSSDGIRCCLFVIGTWNMIHLIHGWGQVYYNHEFDPTLFKHGTRSSLVIYMFHWLYIDLVQVLVVIPLALSPLPALLLVYPITILFCLLTYVVIIQIPGLCFAFGLSSSIRTSRPVSKLEQLSPTLSLSHYVTGPTGIILNVTDVVSPRSNQKSEPRPNSATDPNPDLDTDACY